MPQETDTPLQAQLSLTFDSDLRHSLNDAKAAHCHTGVVG